RAGGAVRRDTHADAGSERDVALERAARLGLVGTGEGGLADWLRSVDAVGACDRRGRHQRGGDRPGGDLDVVHGELRRKSVGLRLRTHYRGAQTPDTCVFLRTAAGKITYYVRTSDGRRQASDVRSQKSDVGRRTSDVGRRTSDVRKSLTAEYAEPAYR